MHCHQPEYTIVIKAKHMLTGVKSPPLPLSLCSRHHYTTTKKKTRSAPHTNPTSSRAVNRVVFPSFDSTISVIPSFLLYFIPINRIIATSSPHFYLIHTKSPCTLLPSLSSPSPPSLPVSTPS